MRRAKIVCTLPAGEGGGLPVRVTVSGQGSNSATFSYAAPVLSTALLVAFGETPATWQLAASCLLVAAGAGLAAWADKRGR